MNRNEDVKTAPGERPFTTQEFLVRFQAEILPRESPLRTIHPVFDEEFDLRDLDQFFCMQNT